MMDQDDQMIRQMFHHAHEHDALCPVDAKTMMREAMTPKAAPTHHRKVAYIQWAVAMTVLVSCVTWLLYQPSTHDTTPTKEAATVTQPTQGVPTMDWEAPTDFLLSEENTLFVEQLDDEYITDSLLDTPPDITNTTPSNQGG